MTFKEFIDNHLDWKDKLIEYYNNMLSINDAFKYQYFNAVIDLLDLELQKLYDFELLYDEDFVYINFKQILHKNLFKLIGEHKTLMSYASQELKDGQKYRKGTNKYDVGYAGFEVVNQEGTFQFNKNEFEEFEGSNFMFYNYLRRKNIMFGYDIIKEVKELLRLIY